MKLPQVYLRDAIKERLKFLSPLLRKSESSTSSGEFKFKWNVFTTGGSRVLKGIERRKHPRVATDNRVSYICMDDNGNPLKEGVGKAINISQGGILVETPHSFEWHNILFLGIDIENITNRIRGRVVYCNATESGIFRTGIEFLEVNDKILSFVIHLLKTHL